MSKRSLVAYRGEWKAAMSAVDLVAVELVSKALLQARHRASSDLVLGNEGRTATSSDLLLESGLVDPHLRLLAPTDNQAIVTTTGNDLIFDHCVPDKSLTLLSVAIS